MTTFQNAIKYCAIALAICLIIGIFGVMFGAFGFIGSLFDDETVVEDMTSYDVAQDITKIQISINAASVTIKKGEKFLIESNLKKIFITDKNGILKIKEDSTFSFGATYTDAALIIHIPENTVFEEAEITTGAGVFQVDTLSANKLQLELGAGKVDIESLNAFKSAEIDGGAGKVTIESGSLKSLELSMGVGEFNLTSALLGSCDLDYGVGSANLTLLGSKYDYRLEFSKGIGDIVIDGESVSIGDEGYYGNGENHISIDSGVGNVKINFKD